MDTSKQLHELEATGWKRGLYDDVKRTFRAPIVNWIFRTAMANEPEFTRYAWGQVKPLFETRAFARLSVAYRDTVVSSLEENDQLPTFRRAEADLSPAEYAELRGQLATFDVVAPRLAVLFETMDRGLHEGDVGTDAAADRTSTQPFPSWLDRDRGRPPSLVDSPAAEAADTVADMQAFHGFDDGLPSIYRCLVQWPTFAERVWSDLDPWRSGSAFETACEETNELVADFVTRAPYRPQVQPETLTRLGFEDETVQGARNLFRSFNTGAVETVLPMLPALAATVGAEGERSL